MLLVFLMMSSLSILAQEENCDPTPNSVKPLVAVANAVKVNCPNRAKLDQLCTAISLLKEDSDPNSEYLYQYQRIISEASCANFESDSKESIKTKVNVLWEKHQSDFICKNIPGFDVNPGSVLKLAVRYQFKDFLVEAAQVWKVNLNKVDPADSRTLLDYVQKELDLKKGTVNEPALRQYYDVLRKSGAKHKSEL